MDTFREWLSDNLRYIMLIAAILVALAAIFLGVRAVTRSLDGAGESAETKPAVESSAAGDSKAEPADSEKTTDSSTASSTEDKDASSAADDSRAAEESRAAATEQSRADAAGLVTDYFEAVGRQDLEAVLTMVDSLTEEETASVRNDSTVYSNVDVLLRDGPLGDGEDYIAFVSYDYKNDTQYVTHYGLSWLYIGKSGDGSFKIMVQGASDSRVTELAGSLMSNDDEVAAKIASVQEKAAAADEEEKNAA